MQENMLKKQFPEEENVSNSSTEKPQKPSKKSSVKPSKKGVRFSFIEEESHSVKKRPSQVDELFRFDDVEMVKEKKIKVDSSLTF